MSFKKAIRHILDAYIFENIFNSRLPEWTKSIFYPGSNLSHSLEFELFKSQTLTPQMARLKMGFLLRDILEQFDRKTKNQPDTPQIQIYSGQDYTIGSMLGGLKLIDVRLF